MQCSCNTNIVLGLAHNVQVVILNRNSEDSINTQEFVNHIGDESHCRDFPSNTWRWHNNSMVIFIVLKNLFYNFKTKLILLGDYFEGQIDGHHCDQLSSLSKQSGVVSLLICIVKSCHPNGLGDMSITFQVTNILLCLM